MIVTITNGERCAIWWALYNKQGMTLTDTNNALDLDSALSLDTRPKEDFEKIRTQLKIGTEYELEKAVVSWLVDLFDELFSKSLVPFAIGYYARPMLKKLKAALEDKKPEAATLPPPPSVAALPSPQVAPEKGVGDEYHYNHQ